MLQPSWATATSHACLALLQKQPSHSTASPLLREAVAHSSRRSGPHVKSREHASCLVASTTRRFHVTGPARQRSRARSGSRAAPRPLLGKQTSVSWLATAAYYPVGCKGHKHDETVEALRAATTMTRLQWREPAGDALLVVRSHTTLHAESVLWSKVYRAVQRRSKVGRERASPCARMWPSIVSSTRHGCKGELPCLKRP